MAAVGEFATTVVIGSLVSSRQPEGQLWDQLGTDLPDGTQPDLVTSGTTRPAPSGSFCTIHHVLSLAKMIKVAPLGRVNSCPCTTAVNLHLDIKLVLAISIIPKTQLMCDTA